MDYQLDLTQFTCPLPLLTAKKALDQLEQDAILTLQLNHTSSVADFELLCQQKGYRIISLEKESALYRLVIKKQPEKFICKTA